MHNWIHNNNIWSLRYFVQTIMWAVFPIIKIKLNVMNISLIYGYLTDKLNLSQEDILRD